MSRPGIRGLVAVFAVVVLTSCQSGNPLDPSITAGQSAPGGAGSDAACAPIELLTPSGTRVDLTGTWRGGFGVHYVRQDGRCVWWLSMTTAPGGSDIAVLFRGELATDFTLTGETMSVIRPPTISDPRRIPITFKLEFVDPLTGDEALTLRSLREEGVGPFQGAVLRYEAPLPRVLGP